MTHGALAHRARAGYAISAAIAQPRTTASRPAGAASAKATDEAQGRERQLNHERDREPGPGDLLLAPGSAPDTLADQALSEMRVDVHEPARVTESVRARAMPSEEEQIEAVRQSKQRALEAEQLKTASRLRDEERRLTRRTKKPSRRHPSGNPYSPGHS